MPDTVIREATMKAWRAREFGPPEVMLLEAIPDRSLVKVRAVGVGHWDGWIRAGKSARYRSLSRSRWGLI